MAHNMSYCRWQNTLADFRDCVDSLGDKSPNELSPPERQAYFDMRSLAVDFLEQEGYNVTHPDDISED